MLLEPAMDLRSVAHWVSGHLDAIEHEHRVVRLASELFDLTQEIHGLGSGARHLLRGGALVHDVGRAIDKAEHPVIGARMILRDRRLRVSESERRALAFLTLYHRDSIAAKGDEAILNSSDNRDALRTVLAILRAADALDSRSQETPRIVFSLKKKRLKATCYLPVVTAKLKRVYERRKKLRMLEEVLGVVVEVELRSEGRVAALVA